MPNMHNQVVEQLEREANEARVRSVHASRMVLIAIVVSIGPIMTLISQVGGCADRHYKQQAIEHKAAHYDEQGRFKWNDEQ